METEQIQRNRNIEPRGLPEVYPPDEELVCANCGYSALTGDGYEYHVKLCSIPA